MANRRDKRQTAVRGTRYPDRRLIDAETLECRRFLSAAQTAAMAPIIAKLAGGDAADCSASTSNTPPNAAPAHLFDHIAFDPALDEAQAHKDEGDVVQDPPPSPAPAPKTGKPKTGKPKTRKLSAHSPGTNSEERPHATDVDGIPVAPATPPSTVNENAAPTPTPPRTDTPQVQPFRREARSDALDSAAGLRAASSGIVSDARSVSSDWARRDGDVPQVATSGSRTVFSAAPVLPRCMVRAATTIVAPVIFASNGAAAEAAVAASDSALAGAFTESAQRVFSATWDAVRSAIVVGPALTIEPLAQSQQWPQEPATFLSLAPPHMGELNASGRIWQITAIASFAATALGYWYCSIHPANRKAKRAFLHADWFDPEEI